MLKSLKERWKESYHVETHLLQQNAEEFHTPPRRPPSPLPILEFSTRVAPESPVLRGRAPTRRHVYVDPWECHCASPITTMDLRYNWMSPRAPSEKLSLRQILVASTG